MESKKGEVIGNNLSLFRFRDDSCFSIICQTISASYRLHSLLFTLQKTSKLPEVPCPNRKYLLFSKEAFSKERATKMSFCCVYLTGDKGNSLSSRDGTPG